MAFLLVYILVITQYTLLLFNRYRWKRFWLRNQMSNLSTLPSPSVVISMASSMISWSFSRPEVTSPPLITFYGNTLFVFVSIWHINQYHVVHVNFDLLYQGDFVDRGYNSREVFTILLLLKARYAFWIFLTSSCFLFHFMSYFFWECSLSCIHTLLLWA